MLIGDNIRTRNVYGLKDCDLEKIKAFFQGAVYCWCNNKGTNEWFNARDFIGKNNFYWEHYPLGVLYFRQIDAGKTDGEAFEQAAKDAGTILKKVLADDDKTFETQEGYTRSYRWIGE